jgi:nicotinamidase-related amidase
MATVLLVIDVQRMLIDALPTGRRATFLQTLNALIDRARRVETAVVYVRHDGGPTELTPGTRDWQIAAEIAPRAGEPIVDKRFSDGFRETTLASVLADLDADHLVICGMQTEHCVAATFQAAVRHGYRVTLVEDGHATFADGGQTEDQIRAQVNDIARVGGAQLLPAASLFRNSPDATHAPV